MMFTDSSSKVKIENKKCTENISKILYNDYVYLILNLTKNPCKDTIT
jgi:hypothetical protein